MPKLLLMSWPWRLELGCTKFAFCMKTIIRHMDYNIYTQSVKFRWLSSFITLLTFQAELLGRHHPLGPRRHFHQALHSHSIPASVFFTTTLVQDRYMDQRIVRNYARDRVDRFIHLPMLACGLLLEMVYGLLWRISASRKMPTPHTPIPRHSPNSEHSIGPGDIVSSCANNTEPERPDWAQDCSIRYVFTGCFRHRLRYRKNRDDFPRY